MNMKKWVGLLLVLALALGTLPAAQAAQEVQTVTVDFTSQGYGAFLHAPQRGVEVAADLAERYGYTDSVVGGVSALDVLVRAHEVTFGGDFTADTKDAFLVVEGGSISTLFGVETASCGFAVDHAQPHDDVFNDAYQCYGGYTVAQAPVSDGALVEFFLYQTQYGMLDYYVWFAQNGRRMDALSLTAGETLSLDVEGYVIGWYGSSTQEVIDRNIANTRDYGYLEGGQAAWVDPATGALDPIPDALIDEDSVLTLTAPEEPGTYYLTVCLTPEDPEFDPAISMPLMEVTVAPPRTAGAPDRVVDYLCVNSQYTNGDYGSHPERTLCGGTVSLGGFGGYITYYYEDGLCDDPAHPYGVDFYVNGNAAVGSAAAKTSFFEPGQVWVSEDAENWYALAGSAHYDEGVDWDYTVTYEKTPAGKTAWTDSLGNTADGARFSGPWPSQVTEDAIALSGILLPTQSGEAFSAGVAADAYPTQWGYADCQPNGTENPYLDNTGYDLAASGFDLAWAVDAQGLPVDVSNKGFHYVKIQTASNIWHPAFGEKSPEIAGVVRAQAQAEAVGRTALPQSVTVTDGHSVLTLPLQDGQQVYDLDVGEMGYLSLSLQGTSAEDNVYLNNRRLAPGQALEGLRVTPGKPRLVRILVQNGEKEPAICVLRLTASATVTDALFEGMKVNVGGSLRQAQTTDGQTYRLSVGAGISQVSIAPVTVPGVAVHIDGQTVQDHYPLQVGENTFSIQGEKDGAAQTLTLVVTRAAPSQTTGKLTVWFSLLGDDAHGPLEDGKTPHTLTGGGLATWMESVRVQVSAPATVLDVVEAALADGHSLENAQGNYISAVDGLAELDNGPRSGWLYTLNGRHPDLGVAEQTVKNGDKLVLHYTDDWSLEKDALTPEKPSGGGSGGSSGSSAAVQTGLPQATVRFETNSDGKTVAKVALPRNANRAIAVIPLKGLGEGDVLVAIESDGGQRVLKKSLVEDRTAYALVDAPCALIVSDNAVAFDDMAGHWAQGAVDFVSSHALLGGTGANAFSPDMPMSRAMLATALYRLEDASASGGKSPFADVSLDTWYTDAVIWANVQGIVTGTGDGFAPDREITRQELAVMLHRYAKSVDMDLSKPAALDGYTDSGDVAPWAREAMAWAVGAKLLQGRSSSVLAPQGVATRAEVAAVLQRLVAQMLK